MKVLFVSKRGACRGPMAESIFNSIGDKYNTKPFSKGYMRAQSAGLDVGRRNRTPEDLALRVLAENELETLLSCRQVSLRDLDFCFVAFLSSFGESCNLLKAMRRDLAVMSSRH